MNIILTKISKKEKDKLQKYKNGDEVVSAISNWIFNSPEMFVIWDDIVFLMISWKDYNTYYSLDWFYKFNENQLTKEIDENYSLSSIPNSWELFYSKDWVVEKLKKEYNI